jgi:SNF2 family DNA or RNA helicase
MQADIYEQERSRIRNTLLDADQRERRSLSATVLAGLTRLRLLANHPAMLQHDYSGDAAKFEQIVEQAEVLFAEGHKVLIFSSFVKQLKLISRYFDERGWSYAWLSGSTTNREAVIREFETDERKQAFLISLQAGGTGLNLTTADYVFLVDPWWNPSAELQAVSRAHRIGQHKPVTFYRFITRDTIEEKIRHLQEKKQALADGLMGSQLTVEELEALLA